MGSQPRQMPACIASRRQGLHSSNSQNRASEGKVTANPSKAPIRSKGHLMTPSDEDHHSTPTHPAKGTGPPSGLVWEAERVKFEVPTTVLLALIGLLLALVRAFA